MGKTDREQFVHSDGTTALETLVVIIPSILNVYITTFLVTIIPGTKKWQFSIEFVFLLVPSVLNITILTKYVYSIIPITIVICMSFIFIVHKYFRNVNIIDQSEERRIPFLTNARATINILSVIAVLAVDFPVFPRRFAKTSSFGYSLMDLGVGLYIFANSIVSPESLNRKDSMSKIMKNCIPLFILGMLRLVLTKQVDYQVPVTEYGTHWNFFHFIIHKMYKFSNG
ncbi:hypothetical protein HHI36_004673 [Cryptolaemus montrouzieri]|uniref:Phosphatidylinositol-glycan biosynthesis class W protein n=1 Tax=Cryptolaemus montrouzieri TaxID=559131 RepID=A0ABD2NS86_9CUCU